jgi:ribosome-binding factor A
MQLQKSQRQLQIGENIKRIMAEIFSREGISTMRGTYITVLEADVSPDTKSVRIYLDIFGNEEEHEKIIKKFNEAAPNFRYKLAQKLTLRTVPEIIFMLDKTEAKAIQIESLLEAEAQKIGDKKVGIKKPNYKK